MSPTHDGNLSYRPGIESELMSVPFLASEEGIEDVDSGLEPRS